MSGLMDKSWERIQKKTFTKWVNSHLAKRGMAIEDISKDFRDGIKLINLLEIIGDAKIGRYNKKPRLEIQMRENIEKALKFIESRGVKLTAIGAGDIFEGNQKLILGMIWTVILRFQIEEISLEELTAKEALLLWCQRKTEPYDNVNIKNFTWSWQDGLGFCALIHAHRPDLIDYASLSPNDKEANLNLAFDVAEKELGIPKFLDAEDMIDIKPDERSVITYLSEYFKYFSKGLKKETAARRITKVLGLIRQIEEQIEQYNLVCSNYLNSIGAKIDELNQRDFPNDIFEIKRLLDEFKTYKKEVKPKLSSGKLEVSGLLNQLNTKLKVNNRSAYTPPDELTVDAVEKAWEQLELAEKARSKDLRDTLRSLEQGLLDEYEQRCEQFENFIKQKTLEISELSGDIPSQIEQVEAMISETKDMQAEVDDIQYMSQIIEKANLEYHTDATFDIIEVGFKDLLKLQADTKEILERQMTLQENSKISQEQLNEYQTTFRMFDKDKKNALYDYEFAAVLQALGDDLSDSEMKKVFEKYDKDGNGTIEFSEFVDFMISRVEDNDSEEQILESFRIIAGGRDTVSLEELKQAGMGDQIDYLREAMEGDDDNKDYISFTKNVLYF